MGKGLKTYEIEEMKQMVIAGVAPEDISQKFDCAISTVHYYKAKFKKEGLEFPTIRGQRPTGEFKGGVKGTLKPTLGTINVPSMGMNTNYNALNPLTQMLFIVNGVEIPVKPGTQVHVDNGAKSINISQGKIEINY